MKKLFSLAICVIALLFAGCEPNGPISSNKGIGVFSISETTTVTFSPGNLQYHPADNKWRFAASQLDCIGEDYRDYSPTYNGWLDLFGWSTSATNFGVSIANDYDDYFNSFVDWGTNKIGNNAPNTWRTLTASEWAYILYDRPNASSLMGIAQVNGVNGLILLPDSWTSPRGITFKSGFHDNEGEEYYAAHQTFTDKQWSKLEARGAVFLPANHPDGGGYWSATESYDRVCCLFFYSSIEFIDGSIRDGDNCVRLVKDL